MEDVFWDDDPSFPHTLPVQVHAPRAGNNSFLRLLGPHVGAFTHYLKEGRKRRPTPCLKGRCPHCERKLLKVWKAYVPALLWRPSFKPNWLHVVGEITDSSFAELLKQVKPGDFRGKVVEVSRGQTSSLMRVRLVEDPQRDSGQLPPPFDVKIVLRRLWGLARATPREEGTFDPAPPPIEAYEPPAPVVEDKQPEPTRLNFKAMLDAAKNRNGGAH